MHVQIRRQMTINAPAEEVWRVLAHEFDRIGQWASVIPTSTATADVAAPEGAPVGGRVCSNSVPGFDDIQEDFTYYDEEAKRFSYRATKGTPSFFKLAENNWSVRSLGPNESLVEARGEMELSLFPGLFLVPLLKCQMDRMVEQAAEELKYYVEQGRPHPRKLKAQQKELQKAAAGL